MRVASLVPAAIACAMLVVLASCSVAISGTRPSDSNAGADPVATAPGTPNSIVADLVVADVSVSDGAPAAGAAFTLSVTVGNDGGVTAGATTLRYYQSQDATITTSDIVVSTAEVAELAASGRISQSTAAKASTTPGTYYYGACVDAASGETDTTNNCSTSFAVTVAGEQFPDLLVTAPSVSNGSPARGASFTLSATVTNGGDGPAGATRIRYYRSADATITTSDTPAGEAVVPALDRSRSASKSVELPAPSTPGTYHYGACVVASQGETDTTNNCSSSIPVNVQATAQVLQGAPDLVAESMSVSDGDPNAGAAITVSATVRNVGDGTAQPSTVRFVRSADATITSSDPQVGTDAVGSIAPTGSSSESMETTVPTTPGTYYYGACVDAVAGESDSSNNCSTSVRVTVPEPRRPDLTVTAPSVSDSSPAGGAGFTLSATVRNGGDGAAAATGLKYYRSADATITTSDTQVGTDAITALAASGSSSESVELTAPTTPGTYYYGACVDAVTDESNTANNCSSAVTVTVPKAQPLHPDLEVTLTVNNASQQPGATFNLSATVSNTGDGESPSTTLRYYQSTDATITTSDTSVGTDAIGVLAAAGTSAESISLTAPSSLGSYYYGACVDSVTDESDTTNNCSSAVQVSVQAWQPNLLMSDVKVDLTDPVTGETFTLSATVVNGTRAASPATTLRYYRSTDSTITTSDTQVGTDAVDALSAHGSSAESISLTAPATVGAYYYGACVDAVTGESDTTDNCSASVKVDVVAPQRRVDISPRTLTFNSVGDSETVTVRILDENGDEDTDATYEWISSYPVGKLCCDIEKVDAGLKFTVTKAGSVRLDISSADAKTATLRVTAYQKAVTLEVSPATPSLEVGETATLSATVKDANGNAIEGLTVYWTTSDSDVATVQGADAGGETGAAATVSAEATGTATVTARHAAVITGTAAVTVTSSNQQ